MPGPDDDECSGDRGRQHLPILPSHINILVAYFALNSWRLLHVRHDENNHP